MRVTDKLFDLEHGLDDYLETKTSASDRRNRRLLLRKALTEVHQMGYQEGYADGLRDFHETQEPAT